MAEMTKEQLDALIEYIKALIDDRLSSALGRDGLHEAIRLADAEAKLDEVVKK